MQRDPPATRVVGASGFFTIATGFLTDRVDPSRYNRNMSQPGLADRRDRVIEQLSAGFAASHFEVDELERRVSLAHAATTPAELDALVTDLALTAPQALVPARRMRVVLGSIERAGRWVVPQQLAARVVWGNLVIDLRDAQLGLGVTTIDVHVTMGNVEIIVPPGVDVDVDASSFLANVEDRTVRGGSANKTVSITGRVRLGNLEVSTLRPGETKRDARRRTRWERHMRRHMLRRACMHRLPPPDDFGW